VGFRFSGCKCTCTRGFSGSNCLTPPDPCAGIQCNALDSCHGVGICGQGVCSNPIVHDGTGCDDGNSKTINDACSSGVCKGTDPCSTKVCPSGSVDNQCKGVGRCEVMEALPECIYDNLGDGAACNDGNANTKADQCRSGICIGKDLCWDVVCNPLTQCYRRGDCANGVCSHPKLPEGTLCDDGNPKTGGDKCDGNANCAGTLDPVDGGLSDWGACTVSCGGGTQTRACDSPATANGGKPCCGGNFGKAGCPDIQLCNTQQCASILQAALAAKQAADAGPVTACTSAPCKNDGKCTLSASESDGFHCECFPGWTSPDCSVSQTDVQHSAQDYNGPEARVTRVEGLNDAVLGVPRFGERGERLLSEWAQYQEPNFD